MLLADGVDTDIAVVVVRAKVDSVIVFNMMCSVGQRALQGPCVDAVCVCFCLFADHKFFSREIHFFIYLYLITTSSLALQHNLCFRCCFKFKTSPCVFFSVIKYCKDSAIL